LSLTITPSPSFSTIPINKDGKVVNRKVCSDGHFVGYQDIHIKLHTVLHALPYLRTADNNVILTSYWIQFDGFYELLKMPGWVAYTDQLTSMQRIDREIRNILQPSQHRAKSREMEQLVRVKYAGH